MTSDPTRTGARARRAAALHLELENDIDRPPSSAAPASGFVRRSEPGAEEALFAEAAHRGHAFLARAVEADEGRGLQSVIGLDAGFTRTLAPAELRAFARQRLGVDIGFDAGDETFSSMFALKLFGRAPHAKSLFAACLPVARGASWNGRYRFFCDANGFAADTDCTGVAAAALYEAGALAPEALLATGRELLASAAPADVPAAENLDEGSDKSNGPLHRGVVMVYWEDGREPGVSPRGRKHDAAVAASAVYTLLLAAELGLEDPRGVTAATMGYLRDHLRSGAYLEGTRYYPSPDTFLFYASCLCRRFAAADARIGDDLRRAVQQRLDAPADADDALSLAQRIAAASNLGLTHGVRWALYDLAAMQALDGAWPAAPFYSLGKRALYFGSRAVTTLFAVKALELGRLALSTAPRRLHRNPDTRSGVDGVAP